MPIVLYLQIASLLVTAHIMVNATINNVYRMRIRFLQMVQKGHNHNDD
jgi:hypothetical protein